MQNSNEKSLRKNCHRRSFLRDVIAKPIVCIPFLIILDTGKTFANDGERGLFADLIVVWKSKRRMTLFKNAKPLKTYRVRLGFHPIGPKEREGDGKTPEGHYHVSHKNPNSSFHKSLGLNYPNSKDKFLANRNGVNAGKDIFIHGGPKNFLKHLFFDWTEGCIAVTDQEIDEIYNLVPVQTPVYITV